MGIEASGQHGGGVVEATHLQEELPPRDLGDVQKDRESTFERLGDESVDRLKRVVGAIEREQRRRPPEPGQQVIESVWFGELVAEDRVEELERMGEVPADVLKTALAESERKPGGRVKARAGGYGFRKGGGRLVYSPACDEVVGQLRHVREPQMLR